MLLQNVTLWHNEYFNLKELENGQAQKGFSDLSLKQVIRPSCEMCPPYTLSKEQPYL